MARMQSTLQFDRVPLAAANNSSNYVALGDLSQYFEVEFSCVPTVNCTAQLKWGRATDDIASLPHNGATYNLTAGQSFSERVKLMSGPFKVALVFSTSAGDLVVNSLDICARPK